MQSTNITVTLTKKQYLTIKNLFHATSKNATSALQYVYYHAQKKRVVACDGHITRWEKMDLGENDIFFESHYFSYPKSALKSLFPHENITREFTIMMKHENIFTKLTSRDYCKTLIDGKPCAFCGTNSCHIGNSPMHCYEERVTQKEKYIAA